MIERVIVMANALNWALGQPHVEIFSDAAPHAGDRPLKVAWKRSGERYLVPADNSIQADADLRVAVEGSATPVRSTVRRLR